MFKVNPYRPGAGLMPTYLAGREEDIQNVEQMFDALNMNIPTQYIIFSGLRGVGKTVLINRLQKIAENKEISDDFREFLALLITRSCVADEDWEEC